MKKFKAEIPSPVNGERTTDYVSRVLRALVEQFEDHVNGELGKPKEEDWKEQLVIAQDALETVVLDHEKLLQEVAELREQRRQVTKLATGMWGVLESIGDQFRELENGLLGQATQGVFTLIVSQEIIKLARSLKD